MGHSIRSPFSFLPEVLIWIPAHMSVGIKRFICLCCSWQAPKGPLRGKSFWRELKQSGFSYSWRELSAKRVRVRERERERERRRVGESRREGAREGDKRPKCWKEKRKDEWNRTTCCVDVRGMHHQWLILQLWCSEWLETGKLFQIRR